MTEDEYKRLYNLREFCAGLIQRATDQRQKLNQELTYDDVDRLRQILVFLDGVLLGAKQ